MSRTQPSFTLTRTATVLLLLCGILPSSLAYGAAGKVEFVSGDAQATGADGVARPLQKGSELNASDLIDTHNGRVQLRFSDGGYMALAPHTQFKINRYQFNGSNDGKEEGFFSLVRGSLRTITGLIGKTRRDAYQLSTPTATIGIRGTEYSAEQTDGLKVSVAAGSVVVNNQTGSIVLNAGQTVFMSSPQSTPQPKSTGGTSSGGSSDSSSSEPESGSEQSSGSSDTMDAATGTVPGQSQFTASDSVTSSGTSAAVPTVKPTLADGIYQLSYEGLKNGGIQIYDGESATVAFQNGGQIIGFTGGSTSDTVGSATVADAGNTSVLGWGRWVGGVTGNGYNLINAGDSIHFAVGQITPSGNLPTSGSATYSRIGSTTPTSTLGATTGSFNGTITVNFSSTYSLALNATITSGATTYTANASTSGTNSTFGLNSTMGGSCTPSCSFFGNGFFAGASGSQIGLSYKLQDFSASPGFVVGAAAFSQ